MASRPLIWTARWKMVAFHPEGLPGDIGLEGKAMSSDLDIGHCVGSTR